MRITVQKRYICLPVSPLAQSKKLTFYRKDTLVLDLDCRLDAVSPKFVMYLDMNKFLGDELDLQIHPEIKWKIRQTDEKKLEKLWEEPYRPQIHFTPKIGYHNDPNGLIHYHGVYHLFYQHNPFGTEWGNMHWGHATSPDLIHWEEQEIALCPDETGTMYSGSAIEDTENVTGLKKENQNPMLLFYTAAGDHGLLSQNKKRTQCLAYSTDGGKTFEKFKGNPVLPHFEGYNRDPKVVWVQELNAYLMVLYLADDRYGFFRSKNLLDWECFQQISIPGDAECPDIFSFEKNGRKYWALAGASDRYVIGEFECGLFVPKTKPKRMFYCGSYAAQSFSGMPDGRVVRIGWDKLWIPCERSPMQMGIPVEVTLEQKEDDLSMVCAPVREIETLYEKTEIAEHMDGKNEYLIPMEPGAYDIRLSCQIKSNTTIGIFGSNMKINSVEQCIEKEKVKIPIPITDGKVELRMIVDTCSLELYADGGKACGTFLAICDQNLPYLSISSNEKFTIHHVEWSRLSSIHYQQKERG